MVIWYKEKWKRGKVLENDKVKLIWDEFNLRKTTTTRRPDLILESKKDKKIWVCDMACPQQRNISPVSPGSHMLPRGREGEKIFTDVGVPTN